MTKRTRWKKGAVETPPREGYFLKGKMQFNVQHKPGINL
jgi:hypothetical protein